MVEGGWMIEGIVYYFCLIRIYHCECSLHKMHKGRTETDDVLITLKVYKILRCNIQQLILLKDGRKLRHGFQHGHSVNSTYIYKYRI